MKERGTHSIRLSSPSLSVHALTYSSSSLTYSAPFSLVPWNGESYVSDCLNTSNYNFAIYCCPLTHPTHEPHNTRKITTTTTATTNSPTSEAQLFHIFTLVSKFTEIVSSSDWFRSELIIIGIVCCNGTCGIV